MTKAVIEGSKIPQCSSTRRAIPFTRKHGSYWAVKRREFISLVGGAAAWPLAADAQQSDRMRRVGVLMGYAESDREGRANFAAFQGGLQKLGWTEGRNIRIDARWAAADADLMQRFAKELVGLQPDLILTQNTPITAAMLQLTRTIPIIFANVSDPVGSGFVAGLPRPGGNVTGLSLQSTDLAGKRLELFREVVPDLRRLAIMAHVGNPGAVLELAEVRAAARALGLEVATLEIRRAEDIAPAFEALNGRVDALYIETDALIFTHRIRINTLSLAARLPTMHSVRAYVETGGSDVLWSELHGPVPARRGVSRQDFAWGEGLGRRIRAC